MSAWEKGTEARSAIAELANAMQTAIGWLDGMNLDELEHLGRDLERMHRIVAQRLWVLTIPQGKPCEVVDLFPRCQYGGELEPCPRNACEHVRWRVRGTEAHGEALVCGTCGEALRRNLAALGNELEP